jgi:hypothetical protein
MAITLTPMTSEVLFLKQSSKLAIMLTPNMPS